MKVIIYQNYYFLKKCKKLIAIFKCDKKFNFAIIKNGVCHNSNYYSFFGSYYNKYYYYKGKMYGSNKMWTDLRWKNKIKTLKYEEKLKIFK